MHARTLARSSIDRSFYAMLKLHVFATVHHVFLRSFQHGQNGHAVQEAKPTLGRFTARKADHLFVPRNGNARDCSADFLGFTPHKVREKLAILEQHGTVALEGRGLRDAYTYRWTEPLTLHEVCSFMVLHRHTADDLSINIELSRLFAAVGRGAFTVPDFLAAYERAHLEEYGGTRWGARRFERLRHSPAYATFLKARLRRLLDRGLLTEMAGGRLALTQEALDLVHHFHLFVDGVPYVASPALCGACPLFQTCRVDDRVQPVLETLSDHLLTFVQLRGGSRPAPAANGQGPSGTASAAPEARTGPPAASNAPPPRAGPNGPVGARRGAASRP